MLNLSLAAISRGGARAQWEIPRDDPLWEGSGVTLLEPVSIEVEVRSIGDGGVLVRGRMRTSVELECRRCLAAVASALDEPLDLLFEELRTEEADELAGEVHPLPAGDELDLGEPIREQLLVQVPAYVVCNEACRGLCPQCGADLNQTSCECVPSAEPGPWDALKNLKFD
jgi:uncharacterized protein